MLKFSSSSASLFTYFFRLNCYHYFLFPLSPHSGLNSGVMLMDLDKMRRSSWSDIVSVIKEDTKGLIGFEDQDILNIMFAHSPEHLFVMPCQMNFRFVLQE